MLEKREEAQEEMAMSSATTPADVASRRAPRIIGLGWGHLEVEDPGSPTKRLLFKDAKLYPGGARAWDWNETGTRHRPGIQPADVTELLEHGARVLVLSKGMLGQLQVAPETLALLEQRGVGVHVLRSQEAVEHYNALRNEVPVGGLFHSTC